ncbi:MAG: hypothetical protein LUE29_09500 [Lachnospiraceae bacterium]|nr:hypothetical protein [Lachnospiraceae bacterium]
MEEKDINGLLEDELKRQFNELQTLDAGSEEQSRAVENVVKLYKAKIDEQKAVWDSEDSYDRRVMEVKQARERWIKLGIDAAGIVLPMIFYTIWTKAAFGFETNGYPSTMTTKELWHLIRPTKK